MILIYLTFFARRRRGQHNFRDKINFAFLEKVWRMPEFRHPHQFMTVITEVLGNIAAFLPFPAALCIIFGRRFSNKQILFIVLCSTFTIECLQFIFSMGIFDIDDIFLNFLGGVAGIVIFDFLYKQVGYENFDLRH
ncbi:VanZ family protein [Flavobacterium sp. RHBU_24]|uniref:VanZ family protein n=1 Tax=Flavobacterium sp. RHBU_24 TaxID=3391185 RepID=UPI003984F4C3